MRALVVTIFFGTCFLCRAEHFKYPNVRRDDKVEDDYFGTKIGDPYRWLEDLDSPETKEFIHAQNSITHEYIRRSESRSKINETLTNLWNYAKEGLPKKRGNNYFLYKNSGVQNQWIMYKAANVESLYKDDAEVFLNPNEFSEDGTVALKKISFAKSGNYAAYTISRSGSDWTEINIKNVTSGKNLDEILKFTKFTSIAWTRDEEGFFYTRYPETKNDTNNLVAKNEHQKVYFHRLGTEQDKDPLMFELLDHPDHSVSVEVSDDGEYLVISSYVVINEEYLYYAKLGDVVKEGLTKKLTVLPIVKKPASYSFIANNGPIFYLITNEGAPNYRFVGVDINNPESKFWTTLIPEHEKNVLSWVVAIANDKIMVSYNRDVKSTLEVRNLQNGTLIYEYPLEAGSIQSTESRREQDTFYFKLATFSNPGVSYKLHFDKDGTIPKDLKVERRTAFKGLDTTLFETLQVFYTSKDGTSIPMFIVKKKAMVPTPDTPLLMYGYGGFSSSMEPFFSVAFLSFVAIFDGVLAFPNIRGGGEYGTKWWDGGRLFNKQNVFDDFAYAAKYLISQNYTSPSKLVIQGGSNGGLLVAACANFHPELYGAVIAEVGVMDMLRFQKFTVGSFWCGEFGCSDQSEAHFKNLLSYSPLHNIKANTTYPATLVVTADHDDRVVPSHSFKYIAQLQHTVGSYKNQTQPLVIRIEEKAGHGAGKPTWKVIEEYVDIWSFIQVALKLPFVLKA